MHQARHRTGETSWRIRPRSLAALVVAAAGLAAAVWLPGRNDAASASVQHPAFSDDFNASRGAALDPAKWCLDGDPDNGVLDGDGDLVLTRQLRTRGSFEQRYGHAEARIEVNRAPGVWRAFGVLDRYGRLIPGRLQTLRGGVDPTAGDAFHTYAVDWSPRAIVWSVDGVPTLRLIPQHEAGDGIVLVFNLATDGIRPVRMLLDFVHVTVWARSAPSASPSSSPTASPSASPSASASASASASPSARATAKEWAPYTNYTAGQLVTYKGVTYKVLEAHTSLPGWEPTAVPDLFAKVSG